MTPAVRIVALLVALIVVGLGVVVAVYADGWPRWLIALVLIAGGLACVNVATSDGNAKSESIDLL